MSKDNINKEEKDNIPYTKLSVEYCEVLQSFCGNDNYREWMNTPFVVGNKAHSTDAHFLTIIDAQKVEGFNKLPKLPSEKLNNVIPKERNKNLVIKVTEVKKVFKKAPKEDCYDVLGKDVDCEECDGRGYVEWEYKHHTKDEDCPICDGTGKESLARKIKNGKTKVEEHLNIDIGNSRFYVNKIQRLIDVADKLGETNITLIFQDNQNKGSLFKIKDLEILLMPCMKTDNQVVIVSYT